MNKDNSSVSFKTFHVDQKSLYPSISLCFGTVWKDESQIDLSVTSYQEFLSGCQELDEDECQWNASFSNANYDYVTDNLLEFVAAEMTYFVDKSRYLYVYKTLSSAENETEDKVKIFSGYNGGKRVYTNRRKFNQKCLTFDMPFRKKTRILQHSILLNNEVFPNRIRPNKSDFEVFFHFPNQTIRQTSTKSYWTKMSSNKLLKQPYTEEDGSDKERCSYYGSTYTMNFDIDNLSVLKRRQKSISPCIKKWENDDIEMKSEISSSLKCQPNHWNLNLNLTNCKTRKDMSQALFQEENPPQPSCYGIERYSFSYNEMAGLDLFDIGSEGFKEYLDIDWNATDFKSDIYSEIMVNFVGN